MAKCEDARRVVRLADVDAFFTTLRHPARYNERPTSQVPNDEMEEEMNGAPEMKPNLPFEDTLIFPRLISHKNRAQS